MKQEEKFEYAGSLREEIQELDRMVLEDNTESVPEITHTRGCKSFWTIYCC